MQYRRSSVLAFNFHLLRRVPDLGDFGRAKRSLDGELFVRLDRVEDPWLVHAVAPLQIELDRTSVVGEFPPL